MDARFLLLILSIAFLAQAQNAYYSLANVISDSTTVSFHFNGATAINDTVAYKSVIAYNSIPAGTYTVSLFNGPTQIGLSSNHTFAANTYYTLVAAGLVANPSIVPSTDDLNAPTSGSNFKVRAFNGITNSKPVDVSINNDKKITGLAFQGFSAYYEFPAATWKVEAFDGATSILIRSVDFVGGSVVTLFLEGEATVDLTAGAQATYQYANVRFAHMLANATNVDVYIGGQQIAANVAYKTVTPVATPIFNQNLSVKKAGTNDSLIDQPIANLVSGTQFLIAVVGLFPTAAKIQTLAFADDVTPPTNAGKTRIRFVHANANLPEVVVRFNNKPVGNPISFGTFTNALEESYGSVVYQLYYASGNDQVVAPAEVFTFDSGSDNVIFVVGATAVDVQSVQSQTIQYQYAFARFAQMSFDAGAAQAQWTPSGLPSGLDVTNTALLPVWGNVTAYNQVPFTTGVTLDFAFVDATNANNTFATSYGVTLTNQVYYTVTLEGIRAAQPPLSIGLFQDNLAYPEGPSKAVYTIYNEVAQHAAQVNNFKIDVVLNGTKAANGLVFSEASTPQAVDVGTYTAFFYVAGTTEQLVPSQEIAITSGGVIGIWVTGQYFNSTATNDIKIIVNHNVDYTYAYVRVANALANAPAGEVLAFIDGFATPKQIATNVVFGTFSAYTWIPADLSFAYGVRLTTGTQTLASVGFQPVSNAGTYTLVIAGDYNNQTSVLPIAINDKVAETPVDPNAFTVRFIHAVPYVGDVKLIFNGVDANSGNVLPYGSVTPFNTFNANQYFRLDVLVNNAVAVTAGGLNFTGGRVYEVLLANVPTDVKTFLNVDAAATFFQLRAIHAVVGFPEVNVNVDGKTVFTASYTQVSNYAYLTSGAHTVEIRQTSNNDIVGTPIVVNQNTGVFNFLVAGEATKAAEVKFVLTEAPVGVAGGNDTNVRFINALSVYPAIDVEGAANAIVVRNLTYTAQSEYITFASGNNVFSIEYNGTELTKIANRTYVGEAYSVFAMGSLTNVTGVLATDARVYDNNLVRYINALYQTNNTQLNQVAVAVNGLYVTDVAYQGVTGYYPVAQGDLNTTIAFRDYLQLNTLAGSTIAGVNRALTTFVYKVNNVNAIGQIEDDRSLPADGKVNVRFINLIEGEAVVPEVKLGDNVAFTNVVYGSASNYTTVDSNSYDVSVSNIFKNGTVTAPAPLELKTSKSAVFTIAAIGTPGNVKIISILDNGEPYTPNTASSPSKGLPAWAIALIVIGVILLVAAIAVAGWMIYKRRHAGYSTIPERDA
eukprot:TRINITY_DN592_c0_g1_i1.p1 TRINITY_DN592_c0_g1~~TRINITY_DN592_c0_g1_i1.p1  ORF type:complete len:1293 (-),score=424.44 TRINITY_DN592_c0_g1_i1:105-3935(-)